MPDAPAPHAVVRHVVVFGRVLREGGLEVGPGRVAAALNGLDAVDLARQDDVYWTLRQTLVSRREDLELFDQAFDAWFLRVAGRRPLRTGEPPPRPAGERRKGGAPGPGPEIDGGEVESGAWSADELLRTRDFAEMTTEEFARARALIRAIALERPRRRTHRLRSDRRGTTLDVRALVRASLATGGDPVERAFRSRAAAPRKLVLLLDVSGSMDAYARALLLYLHAARGSGRGVEAFVFGTRLTRLTTELGTRDPDAALAAAAARVLDWSGGTRIGASLKAYNDEWGRRALTRGAVVVVLSDGCERGDPELVGVEMRRLARQAFAVVWVNPLKAHPAYEPLAGGIAAALPYVDRLVSGHDVASLEALGSVLAGIERRHQV
ncbi:MAG: vWA domain-containing protein [Gaiellaceae bacterium]